MPMKMYNDKYHDILSGYRREAQKKVVNKANGRRSIAAV